MIYYHFVRFLAFLFSQCFFPIAIFGIKNIPPKGAFILASNHVSNLDPVIVGICCPRRLNFVAKDSLFKNKALAFFLGHLGAFPIRRDTVDFRAIRTSLRKLKEGKPLMIFPEGTRRSKNLDNKIQPGIGFLVSKSQVPVIPVFVHNSDLAMPAGQKKISRHPVSIYFGKEKRYPQTEDYDQLAFQVMQDISALTPQS